MLKIISRLATVAAVLAVLVSFPPAVDAGKPIKIHANLVEDCPNCATNRPGTYSMLADSALGYMHEGDVQSEILNHNTVYTLDTLDTLVNGRIGSGTRFVRMFFYSPVEGQFPGHALPACWQGVYTKWTAVNWSVFSDNQTGFPDMEVGQQVEGRARLDFNVRNGHCQNQIFRYFLRWYNVCIERTSDTSWEATSGNCGAMLNYGEANLRGQGGRKKETVDYGDWRVPFKLLMTVQ